MAVDTKKYLNTEGLSHFWDKIKTYVGEAVESKPSDIHFVVPNEKEATEALTATVSDINALSPGLAIALRMPFDSVASQTLNINSLGAKPIYYQSNNTDAGKFPSGAVVFLVYETTSIATGCFKAVYSYDGAQPSIYQGATASAAGTAGLVPSAASSEREKFLCGDGTWKEVSTAKEVGYVSSEPSIQSTEVLDNESFIFYETGQANSSILINASITGNADTASSLNHALTLRFNNETDEGNSQYTFNGSSAKEIDFAAGTGISLTASQGTVTIAGNAYQGATNASNGVAGLVPPATFSEKDKYLKGDGTWGTVADTKVNAVLAATTKAYLLGTSTTPTSSAKAVTAIADTAVYLDTTAGRLTAGSFAGNGENITLGTASAAVVTDANKKLVASTTVSATELGYLDGVTSSIQNQLNGKAASSHSHDASDINSGTLDTARIPNLDASKIASGTIDIARLPSGALPILKVVGNETERFALTSSDVQVGDTVQQTDTGLMYYVKDVSKLNSADGYAVYTAGAATSVPWSGVTDKPGTYAPSAHNQASNTINAMTGYSKPSSTSAIGTSDTLNVAIGKLEKALDGKQASGTYLTPSSTLDATKLSGTIPASCYTNTTYSNGTGLNLSGTTFSLTNTAVTAGSYGQASSASPAHGAKISVPYITVDAQGRITSATTSEITLPSDNNTDTLMTQSKSTTNSAYPILMTPTANANADQGAKTGIFGAGVRINPSTSSIIVDGMDAIRFRQSASGKYTSFIRNDGSSTYWLLTNVNDPDGTWNSLRPLTINNATGQCSISGNAATATKATQDASGNVITATYATKTELTNSFKGNARTIEFIAGTQTAVTGALTGNTEDSALYDGKTIFYYMPYNGSGNATLELTLADGTKTGAKVVYWSGTSRMTTHYGAGSVVRLTYRSTDDCWHGGDYDYNANNYDRRLHNNNVKMATAVAANTVIVGTSAGYKQAASGITFDLAYPILVATEAKAAAAVSAKTYEAIPTVNLQTTKASWTGTQYAMAFLVGTLSGNTVTIDSSVFTTTVPATADGKVYIPIGLMASTYQIYFASSKDVYQYTNGSFHLLDTTTAATGSTNGTIKINGTEVAVKGLGTAAYTASTAYLTSSSTLDATKLSGTIPSGCYTNTWTAMTGATSSANGTVGYINAVPPKDGYNTKFWRADGSWQIPYTHPTTSGNKHIPSGGSSGQFLGWSADGTAAWVGNPNWTTHLYAGAASNATANATSATTNAATYIVVCDNSSARNAVQVTGTNGTTVSAVNGKLTIDSPALASVTNAQIDTLFA